MSTCFPLSRKQSQQQGGGAIQRVELENHCLLAGTSAEKKALRLDYLGGKKEEEEKGSAVSPQFTGRFRSPFLLSRDLRREEASPSPPLFFASSAIIRTLF